MKDSDAPLPHMTCAHPFFVLILCTWSKHVLCSELLQALADGCCLAVNHFVMGSSTTIFATSSLSFVVTYTVPNLQTGPAHTIFVQHAHSFLTSFSEVQSAFTGFMSSVAVKYAPAVCCSTFIRMIAHHTSSVNSLLG